MASPSRHSFPRHLGSAVLWVLVISSFISSSHIASAHGNDNGVVRGHHVCEHDRIMDDLKQRGLGEMTVPQYTTFCNETTQQCSFSTNSATPTTTTDARRRGLQDSTASWNPIRIHIDTQRLDSDPGFMCTTVGEVVTDSTKTTSYTCSASDILTTAKKTFITDNILTRARDWFKTVLSVASVPGNLKLAAWNCGSTVAYACCDGSVPSIYQSVGVANADIVLFVTARPTFGSTIAWAISCVSDEFGRPVSAHLNFGPGRLDIYNPTSMLATALHEMTHAFGFSSSKFDSYRLPMNGAPRGTVYANMVERGTKVSKIVTETVVAKVKEHFNCDNWANAGAEIEPNTGGSLGSHWEKRVFMNEFMTATSSVDAKYSAITFALFEDMGWYRVNYSRAEILPWGYREGCSFASEKCSAWNSRYFCQQPNQLSCTADYTAKGYCNLQKYQTSLPTQYQYFVDPGLGGINTYADYCPFVSGYIDGSCLGLGASQTTINVDKYGEAVGTSSRCFNSTLVKDTYTFSAIEAGSTRQACFKVISCTAGNMNVQVGSQQVTCPAAGGDITVPGYRGTFKCPPAVQICGSMSGVCSGAGTLQPDGSCACNPGYVGATCNQMSCPKDNVGNECAWPQGLCNSQTGQCACKAGFTGASCTEKVCQSSASAKDPNECSGNGDCNRSTGTCSCYASFSGTACECVPGCNSSPQSPKCSGHGICDCESGGCICQSGYYGITCNSTGDVNYTRLYAFEAGASSGRPAVYAVRAKEYKYFSIPVNDSIYDLSVILNPVPSNWDGISAFTADMTGDPDLYVSFSDRRPSPATSASQLFHSIRESGSQDQTHFCGTFGSFPRGINDSFRICDSPNSVYVESTPGTLYIAVFGYEASSFTITIEADKCRNSTIGACSGHGQCGKLVAGICGCDPLWSGPLCDQPKCHPVCGDPDITCVLDPVSRQLVPKISTLYGLRETYDCYGNGQCIVQTLNGKMIPTCVCEETHLWTNPTTSQAMCKELIPGIAVMATYNSSFMLEATDVTSGGTPMLNVDSWAIYAINVNASMNVLFVELSTRLYGGFTGADPMLFVRKDKIPSLNTYPVLPSQYMDGDSWGRAADSQYVILRTEEGTLSAGKYFVGVLNGRYGQSPLRYDLEVSMSSGTRCNGSITSCSGHGICNPSRPKLCTCISATNSNVTYDGGQCELPVHRASALTFARGVALSASSFPSLSPSVLSAASSGAGAGDLRSLAMWKGSLKPGETSYFTFDINDTSITALRLTMRVIEPNPFTPPSPLLQLRSPRQPGLPLLNKFSYTDFDSLSVSPLSSDKETSLIDIGGDSLYQQSIVIARKSICSGDDCYKAAVSNRDYAAGILKFELHLWGTTVSSSPSAAIERLSLRKFSDACDSSASNAANSPSFSASYCSGRGSCVSVSSSSDNSSSTSTSKQCLCSPFWTGERCNSPIPFDSQQLSVSARSIDRLCSACALNETFKSGEMKIYRVPALLHPGLGLQITVRLAATNGALVPSIFVSEVLPRSFYDIKYMTATTDSVQVLNLPDRPPSGSYYVVVMAQTATVNASISLDSQQAASDDSGPILPRNSSSGNPFTVSQTFPDEVHVDESSGRRQLLRRDLQIVDEEASVAERGIKIETNERQLQALSSAFLDDSTASSAAVFTVETTAYLSDASLGRSDLTGRNFVDESMGWFLTSVEGAVVLSVGSFTFAALFIGMIYLIYRHPDNRDKLIKDALKLPPALRSKFTADRNRPAAPGMGGQPPPVFGTTDMREREDDDSHNSSLREEIAPQLAMNERERNRRIAVVGKKDEEMISHQRRKDVISAPIAEQRRLNVMATVAAQGDSKTGSRQGAAGAGAGQTMGGGTLHRRENVAMQLAQRGHKGAVESSQVKTSAKVTSTDSTGMTTLTLPNSSTSGEKASTQASAAPQTRPSAPAVETKKKPSVAPSASIEGKKKPSVAPSTTNIPPHLSRLSGSSSGSGASVQRAAQSIPGFIDSSKNLLEDTSKAPTSSASAKKK